MMGCETGGNRGVSASLAADAVRKSISRSALTPSATVEVEAAMSAPGMAAPGVVADNVLTFRSKRLTRLK